MKKLSLLLLSLVLVFMSNCGGQAEKKDSENTENSTNEETNTEENAENNNNVKMVDIDLSEHGIPFVVQAPEGSKVEESFGSYIVGNGDSFQLEVNEGGSSVEEHKENAKKNDINKIKSFVIEEEAGYLTENEVMRNPAFHFYYVKEKDGKTYSFTNKRGSRSFTKAEAQAMYESAKNAK